MQEIYLYAWEVSVAAGAFGFGLTGCRVLGLKRPSLAVAGVLGVSLWIALGGVLNLLHLLRPGVFLALIATGVALLGVELLLRHRDRLVEPTQVSTHPVPPSSLLARIATRLGVTAAALLIVTLMVGAARVRHWGIDDLQGYIALAMKAAQNHSLQSDPFSERRVNVGVGGGIFLDALMFATGDLRAMNFIDSGFGLCIYALAVWELGRRWKVPRLGVAFTILCLPLLPLFKINLTIVYLSAAGFLALLLLLTDADEEQPFTAGRIIALGLIIGATLTTKTPNIVFVLPMLAGVALLYRAFHARHSLALPLFYALLISGAIFLPWSIATRSTVGTYLYPVLGLGTHVSAFHLIMKQGKTGSWQQMSLLTAPNLTLLALCFAVVWNHTCDWAATRRAAIIAYIAAAMIALPICILGLGGLDADRYTAPLVMPVYLLTLLIVFGASSRITAFWRAGARIALLAVGLYTFLFIDLHLMWLFEAKTILYEAFGKVPRHQLPNVFDLDGSDLRREFLYGDKIQTSIPDGKTALDVSTRAFHYNFHRNTIFVADIPGMASPPPGLPLNADAAVQQQFLVDHGVDYLIFERKSTQTCAYPVLGLSTMDWPGFLANQRLHFSFDYLLAHETFTHLFGPWTVVDYEVACHERDIAAQIVDSSSQVYNDGNFVVARLH